MKVLVIFVAVVAVASSYPVVKTWSLSELSKAIETKKEPALQPYLKEALNTIMLALFTGQNAKLHEVVIPSPSGASTWTVEELKKAANDSTLTNEYHSAIMQSYAVLKQRIASGQETDSIQVVIPGMDVSLWTAAEINEALDSSGTKPELKPYLEKAQKKIVNDNLDSVGMVTPIGLIPHKVDYQFLIKPLKNLIKKTRKGL